MDKPIGKVIDNAAIFGCVMLAGFVTRQILERSWEATTDRPAPKNPATPGVKWQEALLWGGTAGVLAGLVSTAVRKGYTDLIGDSSNKRT